MQYTRPTYALLCLFSLQVLFVQIGFAQSEVKEMVDQANAIYYEDPAESYFLCEEAEQIAIETNEHDQDGYIAICKARYLILVTKFAEAGEEINKAIQSFQAVGDYINLIKAYSQKSILLDKLGDKKASHDLAVDVINMQREIGDTNGLIRSLTNISLDYRSMGALDSMLLSLKELSGLTAYIDATSMYYYHQNWGLYYLELELLDSAILEFDRALEISNNEAMTDSKATVLVYLSQVYRFKGNWSKASSYSAESYEIALDNDLIFEMGDALRELILVKEESGAYKEAYFLQHKLIEVEKEIYNLEKISKLKEMEGRLNLAEKEKQIAQGEVDLQAEKLRVEKEKSRNIWMMGITIFVIILMSLTIFIYLKTRNLNKTIKAQKQEVEIKSERLEEAMNDVNASLEYSKMIQRAILPSQDLLKEVFNEYFVLYKPKDRVSGDFYWVNQQDENLLFAVGDCTGHGVPGALVSVVCNEALNKAVNELGLVEPDLILNNVRTTVINSFSLSDDNLNDGMDIALCRLKQNRLQFSGAHNPLWIVRGNELLEFKGDKQPVGKYHAASPFTRTEIILEKNDLIYLFSDGYADQFGGDKMKKFKTANFKKLIFSIRHQTLQEQRTHINTFFEKWKGGLEQVDDVCVLAIKYS